MVDGLISRGQASMVPRREHLQRRCGASGDDRKKEEAGFRGGSSSDGCWARLRRGQGGGIAAVSMQHRMEMG